MSGVYIPGMEMPKSCYFCEMYEADLYWCSAAKRDIDSFDDYDNRSSFCPLVPVPDHGRLIDADALRHTYYHAPSFPNLCKAINEAPTIIPADKEGER